MPIRFDIIGAGLTKRVQPTLILSSVEERDGRIILNVGEPCSEEDVAALIAYMGNITPTDLIRDWEVFCQDVLRKAELPPWDKYVRIYADGGWRDDLPTDWGERAHEILGPGEGIGRAKAVAELRYGVDSQEWFAAGILQDIDLVRKVIARGEAATVARLTQSLVMEMARAEMKPPRSKLRGITRKGIVCETPRFLTLFPLQGNLEASSEESPDQIYLGACRRDRHENSASSASRG
jgi:hypothetical protein